MHPPVEHLVGGADVAADILDALVEVRLVDGLVHVAGPHLATRYLDTDAQPFVEHDGRRWLATHDLGELVDGRLRIRGRADDVIISGGVNVNPHDVEDALAALPAAPADSLEVLLAADAEARRLTERNLAGHLPA